MTEIRKISQLKGWDKNPRSIKKEDFEILKRHIQTLGIYKPLLINKDNIVLGGNMRLKAYQDLGIKEVEVTVVDAQTEQRMVEYALSDNQRMGYYEDQALAELVASVPDIDLGDYKVDLGKPIDLEQLLQQFGPEPVEDEAPEVSDDEPVSKLGEIYQLGRHRVMCGDSTKIEEVERLMDGKKVDMVFTDPPYNVAIGMDETPEEAKKRNRRTDGKVVMNDKMDNESFYQFLYTAFVNIATISKNGASIYVCHADSEGLNFRKAFIDAGFLLKQCIIWNKNALVMGRQDYQWKHEPILYGWVDGGSHQFFGGRDQSTVWDIPKPSSSKEHPTMKPIELITRAINNSSKSEDIVLDTFLGSGSTLIASEQTNRVCYGMELDPHYVDVIRKRYAKFIGKEDEWETITPPIK